MSNNGERQAQYRMENELGSEEVRVVPSLRRCPCPHHTAPALTPPPPCPAPRQAKVQQLQKELEDSKAMNAKLEERMDKLEQK